ncbi:MAG: hypothetical protein FWC47_07090, partial [Oscillospiraceae bacterium]|nr:hypothetical protein [Oscillospiraceae bacterium]
EWEIGMECTWAGFMYAALKYMGEDYTYEKIMGMSGACYRICFVDIWDWSCTDALVSFDYATPLYKAIGYTPVWANRLEKNDRKAERLAIIRDLKNGKPVLAINLRIAPEWGIITGYIDDGSEFLCRTYFDKEIFDKWEKGDCSHSELKKITFEKRGGYLSNDFWPFLIAHFGDKNDKPSQLEILKTSLKILVEVFYSDSSRGYYQGKQAYEEWMKGLSDDMAFDIFSDKYNALRRLSVNDSMLLNLIDGRRAAEEYLRESSTLLSDSDRKSLIKIADNYGVIHRTLSVFRNKVKSCCDVAITYNTINATGVATRELRQEQIMILGKILRLEEENTELTRKTLLK